MTALVTGSSGGLGAAIATELARAGHDVAVHYRSDVTGAGATASAVTGAGRTAYPVGLDLAIADATSLDAACDGLLEEVEDRLGPLDVAVLNAFPQYTLDFGDLTTAAWDDYAAQGLRPTTALLQAAARRWVAAGRSGVIVLIGSIEGLRPAPGHTPYAVAKAALHHLTAAAAYELGGHGIRVVGVAPGLIARDGLEEAWPEGVARWRAASALGRPVTTAEVASAVRFLASPASSGITGITLPVDAGWSAAPGW